ncbi:MAG: aspartate kinase [Bdellovibrionaceae bacterium]|nr:aspartate kinase [Pseudobdellovibrionaceae bacterium]NUM59436.1 aspartate kinase [Pseudobdellovibrionaceae bacterium]
MSIIVKKFGGATVSTPEKIKEIALKMKMEMSPNDHLVIVVSAMGKTTNNLIELAHQVSSHPSRREMDMLLSVGERISMSLLSMALLDLGLEAISFTGSQAGILTTESHENAFVVNIKPQRLQEELKKNKIIILAGFQGVSEQKKEITTLGRGGSDTSAVAMSAALNAKHCEILKDVPSIFSADPNLIPESKPISTLYYEPLMEMTFWGAKVLHYRSVELAAVKKVKVYIGPSRAQNQIKGTWVTQFASKEMEMTFTKNTKIEKSDNNSNSFERSALLSINVHKKVLQIKIKSKTIQEALSILKKEFVDKEIIFPQMLHIDNSEDKEQVTLILTAPNEVVEQILNTSFSFYVDGNIFATITITGTGFLEFEIQDKILNSLKSSDVELFKVFYSAFSITLLIDSKCADQSVKILHTLI